MRLALRARRGLGDWVGLLRVVRLLQKHKALTPEQAAPVRGNGRLVVISHGSGGSPWVHADLARSLVDAGFVVAMPQHRGDNYRDDRDPGPDSWTLRPQEVSRAIDAVAHDPRFAPLTARELKVTDVDVSVLARGSAGFSGADLANLVNEAALCPGALATVRSWAVRSRRRR